MFPCCVVMGNRPAAVTTDQPPEHSPGAARRLAATARGSGRTGSAEPGPIPGAGRLHRAWTDGVALVDDPQRVAVDGGGGSQRGLPETKVW